MSENRWRRERDARKRAEALLEQKSRELFEAGEELRRLNVSLEERVNQRTRELRKLNEELKRSEEEATKLSLVAARTTNGVVLTDVLGRDEWINEGFTRMTGYELDEIKGRTPGSLLQGAETDPKIVAMMSESIVAGSGFKTEVINYSREGRKYWVDIEAQPIHEKDGSLRGFMAIESDITERKRREFEDKKLVRMRDISGEVITSFLEEDDLNRPVNLILSKVGRFLNVSRSYLIRYREGLSWLFDSHEWVDEGVEPRLAELLRVDPKAFGAWGEQVAAGRSLLLDDVEQDSAPAEGLQVLRDGGVRSVLVLPIMVFDRFEGLMAFDETRRTRSWDDTAIGLLQTMVQSISRALERRVARRDLEIAAAKLTEALEKVISNNASLN